MKHPYDAKIQMQEAIDIAQETRTPFVATVLLPDGSTISTANTTKQDGKLYHAEINALLQLPKGVDKSECVLFTTCEPCPMCMGAICWYGIGKVVYGISIEEAAEFLPQIHISCQQIAEASPKKPEIVGGILREDCLQLFRELTKKQKPLNG